MAWHELEWGPERVQEAGDRRLACLSPLAAAAHEDQEFIGSEDELSDNTINFNNFFDVDNNFLDVLNNNFFSYDEFMISREVEDFLDGYTWESETEGLPFFNNNNNEEGDEILDVLSFAPQGLKTLSVTPVQYGPANYICDAKTFRDCIDFDCERHPDPSTLNQETSAFHFVINNLNYVQSSQVFRKIKTLYSNKFTKNVIYLPYAFEGRVLNYDRKTRNLVKQGYRPKSDLYYSRRPEATNWNLDKILHAKAILLELEENQIIEKGSHCGFQSAVQLVAKSNEIYRLVVDYKHLTKSFPKLNMTIPHIAPLLRGIKNLSDCKMIRIDLKSAFYQVKIKEEGRHVTTFRFLDQTYRFKRLPMGLRQSPAILQLVLMKILENFKAIYQPRFIFVYIDDIIMIDKENDISFKKIVPFLEAHGVAINKRKSQLEPVKEIEYIGLLVDIKSRRISFIDQRWKEIMKLIASDRIDKSAIGLMNYVCYQMQWPHFLAYLEPNQRQKWWYLLASRRKFLDISQRKVG
ncbi:MAG: reverse transcriptase domain-containing protein, partial [Chloroflexota bacterium]